MKEAEDLDDIMFRHLTGYQREFWKNRMREAFPEYVRRYKKRINKDTVLHEVRAAATSKITVVTDATTTIGKGLKKSIKNCGKEAGRVARSIGDCVDVDDFVKSIHKAVHTEDQGQRNSNIIHTPIDWSNYPSSAFRRFSEQLLRSIEEDCEDEVEEERKERSKEQLGKNKMDSSKPSQVSKTEGPKKKEDGSGTQPSRFSSRVHAKRNGFDRSLSQRCTSYKDTDEQKTANKTKYSSISKMKQNRAAIHNGTSTVSNIRIRSQTPQISRNGRGCNKNPSYKAAYYSRRNSR